MEPGRGSPAPHHRMHGAGPGQLYEANTSSLEACGSSPACSPRSAPSGQPAGRSGALTLGIHALFKEGKTTHSNGPANRQLKPCVSPEVPVKVRSCNVPLGPNEQVTLCANSFFLADVVMIVLVERKDGASQESPVLLGGFISPAASRASPVATPFPLYHHVLLPSFPMKKPDGNVLESAAWGWGWGMR